MPAEHAADCAAAEATDEVPMVAPMAMVVLHAVEGGHLTVVLGLEGGLSS